MTILTNFAKSKAPPDPSDPSVVPDGPNPQPHGNHRVEPLLGNTPLENLRIFLIFESFDLAMHGVMLRSLPSEYFYYQRLCIISIFISLCVFLFFFNTKMSTSRSHAVLTFFHIGWTLHVYTILPMIMTALTESDCCTECTEKCSRFNDKMVTGVTFQCFYFVVLYGQMKRFNALLKMRFFYPSELKNNEEEEEKKCENPPEPKNQGEEKKKMDLFKNL